MKIVHVYSLLLSVLFLQFCVETQASTQNKDRSIYPVKNLEASLSASASQASVVAVRYTDGIVIVSMSAQDPSSSKTTLANVRHELNDCNVEKFSTDKGRDDESADLIPVTSRGPIRTRQSMGLGGRVVSNKSRIMHLLQEVSGLTLCTTGFASDAQYLVRCAAAHVSEYEHIYAGSTMDAKGVMQDALAPRMASATMSGGSRPFGVQALAISSSPSFQIVTLDPSGNMRYWYGVGACIGKDSHLIKKHLYRVLEDESVSVQNLPVSWEAALDICIRSLLKTAEESQNMKKTPKNEILAELDAMVVFDCEMRKKRGYSCAVIGAKRLFATFEKCYDAWFVGKG